MQCLEFRQLKLTDPYISNQEANLHRDGCAACRAFEKEIYDLDGSIKEALSVDVPEGIAARILLNQSLQQPRRPTRWYWLSMAASFFAVALGVSYLQFSAQSDPEQVLLSHVDHELHLESQRDLKPDHLQQVMYSVNAQASSLPGEVVYASNCIIDGELVAHIVVRDKEHELTLLLVPQPMLTHEVTVQNAEWRGVIKPHVMGNIAVLSRTDYPGNVESDAIRYGQAIKRRTI